MTTRDLTHGCVSTSLLALTVDCVLFQATLPIYFMMVMGISRPEERGTLYLIKSLSSLNQMLFGTQMLTLLLSALLYSLTLVFSF